MNVMGMLRPKYITTYLEETDNLREGLAIMKKSGYTAVPVIDKEGKYVGVVSEGDFLWNILEKGDSILDTYLVKDILSTKWSKAATDTSDEEILIQIALQQNFIPMVDDRNCYIGIITRRDFMQNILQKKIDSRYIINSNEIALLHE